MFIPRTLHKSRHSAQIIENKQKSISSQFPDIYAISGYWGPSKLIFIYSKCHTGSTETP